MVSVFLLCTVLLFTQTSCGKGPSNGGKTIEYGLSQEPKTLDPQIADDPSSFIAIQALFEGLTRLGADGSARPGVAERWESGADSTVFTFHLRSGAEWSDKTPVTAGDFVFAFRRALSPQTASPACAQMFCIQNARKVNAGQLAPDQLGVEAKDARTLVVRLESSYPDFPKLTALSVFMPCSQKFFESTAGRYGLEADCVLGNGPFRIDGKYGWVHGQYLNLRRSATYSGDRQPLPSSVNLNVNGGKIDLSDPVALLKSGTVDAAAVTSAQAAEASSAGCSIVSFRAAAWGLCFNTASGPMKNADVRRAFAQAFDRKQVLSHLAKNTEAAETILLPETTFLGQNYRKLAGGPFYLKRDANAAQTLAKGLGGLGLSEMPSVSVLCPDDLNVKLMLNEMIIAWNSQFHNYFNLEALDESKLLSRIASGNYQLAICPLKPNSDGPDSVLSLFRSTAAGNPAKFSDPAYDALVDRAEAGSGAKAAADYAAAERYLNEQAVFYPLYYEKSYYAMAPGVTGIAFHPFQGGVDFIGAGKE